MEGLVQRPGPVDLKGGNVEAEWQHFLQKFEIYLIAVNKKDAASDVKWALLMGEAGDQALHVYNSFKDKLKETKVIGEDGTITQEDRSQNYVHVLAEFAEYAKEKKSVIGCRETFRKRNQRPKEPFANWHTDLKILIKPCEFWDQEDSLMRDRLVLGSANGRLKRDMLGVPNITLAAVIEQSNGAELKQKQASEEADVDTAQQDQWNETRRPARQNYRGRGRSRGGGYHPYTRPSGSVHQRLGNATTSDSNDPNYKFDCQKCNTTHGVAKCPAFGAICGNCGGSNHWTTACRRSKAKAADKPQTKKRVNYLQKEDDDDSDYILEGFDDVKTLDSTIHQVETAEDDDVDHQTKRPRKEYVEVIKLGGEYYIQFKLDPGSEVNVLPYSIFLKLGLDKKYPIVQKNVLVTGFENKLSIIDMGVTLPSETRYGTRKMCDFLLSRKHTRPLLGIEDCEKLQLIQRVQHPKVHIHTTVLEFLPQTKEEFLKRHIDVFTGVGTFKTTVKINTDPRVPNIMSPPRRYNFYIIERLKGKLEAHEKNGVITKVTDEIPKFISNLVIREKGNGDLRICLDPEYLNKAIVRQKYSIPSLDELAYKVKDKKVFTVLDLKDGFWHVPLDHDSSLLCAFSTPYGVYRFKKLPFGVSCAPEIFQLLNEQIFNDTGAVMYFDDCLVGGKDLQEHDQILKKVLHRAREAGVRFNPDKLQCRLSEVKFMGLLWSHQKLSIDPDRVRAIQALTEPKNKKELQKALGVFNYLRKFVPQMATVASPLCQLLSDKVSFAWLPVHSQAFQQLKNSICQAPALRPYDSTKPMIVQADASQTGLGACLLQEGTLVSAVSRKLTETEQNYAQIEKEMLALWFAASKFEKFIFGMRHVTFHTDHQPLVSICKKPLYQITNNRLKRLRLKMLKFQPQVQYIPGKYMYLADLLSRQYITDSVSDDPDMAEVVHEVTRHISISNAVLEECRAETAKDQGLQSVIEYYKNGWPLHKRKANPSSLQYWKVQKDLFTEQGLVLLDNKIIIPDNMRGKVLQQLHAAHLGSDKTKARARQIVYWPGITADIERITQGCRACERNSPNNMKEPLIPHEVPTLRYQKVSCDLLDHHNKIYLVVVDNFSKWLELKELNNKSSKAVIGALREIFATHGIPEEIFCDNNPLNSYECKEFAESMGSTIVTSSPEYPRSNGLAERGVRTAKQILSKSADSKSHYLDMVRDYNNTPLCGTPFSPAQLLMSRMCRTTVPTLRKSLEPKVIDPLPLLKRRQLLAKKYHDRRARRQPVTFTEGDKIAYRRGGKWHKGTIVHKHRTPRSYIIRQMRGRDLRRNTFHLKRSATATDHIDRQETLNYNIPVPCSQEASIAREPNNGPAPEPDIHRGLPDDVEQPEPCQLYPQRGRGQQHRRAPRPRRGNGWRGLRRLNEGRVTRAGREVRPPMVLNL